MNHKLQPTNRPQDSGFALPLVVIVGLFMMVSGFTLLARTFSSYRGSLKNNQDSQAQEIAERGVAAILQQLNSTHRYLLVNCYQLSNAQPYAQPNSCNQTQANAVTHGVGGWDNGGLAPVIHGASCSGVNINTYSAGINLTGTITPPVQNPPLTGADLAKANQGRWQLQSYTFYGDPMTGGRGVIRMQGTRETPNGDPLSSATIEHHVQVKAKPCSRTLLQESDAGDFPGLLARWMNLGNNDVVGGTASNVYCTGCTTATQMGQKNTSQIDGTIHIGDLPLPPVPTFPPHLLPYVSAGDLKPTNNQRLVVEPPSQANQPFNPRCEDTNTNSNNSACTGYAPTGANPPMCITDSDLTTHCLINLIDNGLGEIKVDTAPQTTGGAKRPVRFYLGGNLTISGNNDLVNTGHSADLAILSQHTSCPVNQVGSQTIVINGTSSIKAFIYAPCAAVGIKGGGQSSLVQGTPVLCNGQTYQGNVTTLTTPRTCIQGDIDGAVWAGIWNNKHGVPNSQGVGSGATGAEITVPDDMSQKLKENFGNEFVIGANDFIAVGIRDWRSFRQ